MRKPNSIIVLHIFHIIRNRSEAFNHFVSEENNPRGLVTRQTTSFELDMINAISAADICSIYCIYHVKFTSHCELIECSRRIRFFIASLMYNNKVYDCILHGSCAGNHTDLLLTLNHLDRQQHGFSSPPVPINNKRP